MKQKFVVLHRARLENFFKLVVLRIVISTSLDEIAPAQNFIEFGLHDQVKVVFQSIFYSKNLTNMCRTFPFSNNPFTELNPTSALGDTRHCVNKVNNKLTTPCFGLLLYDFLAFVTHFRRSPAF
jgi:hypothetical protein